MLTVATIGEGPSAQFCLPNISVLKQSFIKMSQHFVCAEVYVLMSLLLLLLQVVIVRFDDVLMLTLVL